MTYPFECKICGKSESELECYDEFSDFFICNGCRSRIVFRNEEYQFREIYKLMYNEGKEVSPRGMLVKEIENFQWIFPPYTRFVNFESRKLNLKYIKTEFLWYINANKFDISIREHAKMWNDLIQDDGSINSNYGHYIFHEKQFENVLEILKEDKYSRRAIIVILDRFHLLNKKDIPCTESIAFRIRNNQLNMTVTMRSQDLHFGFASDIPIFSFIHEMIFIKLKESYPELKIGNYAHRVDSFHLYKNQFEIAYKIINGDLYLNCIKCPRISSVAEIDYILNRKIKNAIPDEYKFSQWLYV